MRRDDALHALEHFQPALRLPRLGGTGAKAVHEGSDFGDAPDLPRLEHALKRQFFRALLFELRIVARVGVDGAILDVQHPADDGIEKFAIVRNHQQRARERAEPFLQPDDGVEIQVVGGLIQEQQVGARAQRARHGQSHPPAARKLRDFALMIRGFEAEPMHDGRRSRSGAITVDCLQRRVGVGEIHGRIAPVGILDGGLHPAQFGVAIQHEFNRGAVACGDLLLHMGNFEIRRPIDVAAVGGQLAANRRK